ncbi:MAG: hypothetical protein QW641_00530 [Candidatus Aenigmatarchaeota archaeon]
MLEPILLSILSIISIFAFLVFREKRIKREKIEKKFFEICYMLHNSLKEGVSIETSFRKITTYYKSFDEFVEYVLKNCISKVVKNSCILILESLKNELSMATAFSEVANLEKVYDEEVKYKKDIRSLALWIFAFSFFVFPISFISISTFVKVDTFLLFFVSFISSVNLLFFSSLLSKTYLEKLFLLPLLFSINYFIFFTLAF